MPVTINQNKVKFKNPDGPGFIEFNSIAESTSAELEANLRAVGQEVLDTIPDNYETLNNKVNGIVKFQNTAPSTSSTTQVWVDTSSNAAQVAVPTMEEFDDLKSAISIGNLLELSNISAVKGTITSRTPNENYDLVISSSPNRAVIGPFYLEHSVEISCDSSVKYQINELYLNNNHSQSTYRVPYDNNGWSTTQHILGYNPKMKNKIKYYLLCAYSVDSSISDANVFKKLIHIKNVDDQNPLNMIECNTWNSAGEPIGGTTTGVGRVWFETDLSSNSYMYFASNAIMYSARLDGVEYISNSNYASTLQAGKMTVMAKKSSSTDSIFEDFTTFDALYAYLGFTVAPYDYKKVEGYTALVDTLHYYPSAVSAGGTMATAIMGGTAITGNGIGYSHVPSIKINNGYAYITFQVSSTDNETDSTTSIAVAKLNLSDNSYTITKIAGAGTYGGITFDGACTNPYSYIASGTLHIIYNAHVNENTCLAHAEYDLTAGTFSNAICTFESGTSDYSFTVGNFETYIGRPNGIKPYGNELIACDPATDGTYYYISVTSGIFKDGITPILRTKDFDSWELYKVFPIRYGCDCEMALNISGNVMRGASRHHYSDSTICIWSYNMQTGRFVDSVQMCSSASRPTFYIHTNGKLYVVISVSNRGVAQIYQIADNLSMSALVAECKLAGGFGYNSLANDGTNAYVAVQNSNGYSSSKIKVAQITL